MNSFGENTEIVVEEKDYDENYSGQDAELNTCTNLQSSISNIPFQSGRQLTILRVIIIERSVSKRSFSAFKRKTGATHESSRGFTILLSESERLPAKLISMIVDRGR